MKRMLIWSAGAIFLVSLAASAAEVGYVEDFALAREIEKLALWRPAPGGPLEGTPNKFVKRES